MKVLMLKPRVGLTVSIGSPLIFLMIVDLPALSRPKNRMRISRSFTVGQDRSQEVSVLSFQNHLVSSAQASSHLDAHLFFRMMVRRPILAGNLNVSCSEDGKEMEKVQKRATPKNTTSSRSPHVSFHRLTFYHLSGPQFGASGAHLHLLKRNLPKALGQASFNRLGVQVYTDHAGRLLSTLGSKWLPSEH
jgi:hypothetical protein